ncbi:MAG TPA: ATP-dependent metallopeptidase FtsH/Yme1/Tma family protein, partial [Gemmatimonadales bacterium]|nr:ATP-dependent metallopeptidase FtsH/Yme1/Tma family protein [Gemmatimonadales bacterium]
MIRNFRRRLARWRTTPAGWIWPLAIVATIAAVALTFRWWRALPATPTTITYSAFLHRLDQGAVESITVVPGYEVRGIWARPVAGSEPGTSFRVNYPTFEVTPVLERAERTGTPVTLQPRGALNADFWREVLLVALALVVIGFILRRQMGGGPEMGAIGAARRSRTTFADVGGHEGTVAELRELVEFLKAPEAFQAVGARTPKGVLMFGPPGTGKTLMARAVAGEAGVPFFVISGGEVTGFLIGLGVVRIKKLFRQARKRGGVI